MDKKELYKKAYELLNKSTPLKTDCGKLCGKICCEGEEEDSGMYLFPGEEVMFMPQPDWVEIKPTHWTWGKDQQVLLAVCNSSCDRNLRPLACRIFPLTPYMTDNEILQIKMDPRAVPLCPLAKYTGRNSLDRQFIKNVRQTFQILMQDEDIKAYVMELSSLLNEYEKLAGMF